MIWPLALALAFGSLLGAIESTVGNIRSRAKQGFPGMWVYSDPTRRSGNGINASGQVKQIGTIVVNTAVDATVYTWTINGITQTYTSGTGATTTTIAAGIAAVINADPVVRAAVSPAAVTTTVTLTSVWPGVPFTASDTDANITTTEASTASASAATVAFGVAVVKTGLNTNGAFSSALNYESETLLAVPTTSLFVAQVQTITVPVVTGNILEAVVWEVRGSEEHEIARQQTTFATDKDTTLDALIALLEAELPANTVAVTADNATATALVFTAEILGFQFRARVSRKSGGATITIVDTATTGPSIATSVHLAWLGISEFSRSSEGATLTSTVGVWAANGGVIYGIRGCMWVANTETTGPTQNGRVYVELAPGATAGQLYAATSATRVALERSRVFWERDGGVSTDGIAAVRLEA